MKQKTILVLAVTAVAVTGIVASQALAVMSGNFSMRRAGNELIESVSERLGVSVTFQDDPEVTSFPIPRIIARDVTVTENGEPGTASSVTVPELEVSLKVLPLLIGQVEVERLTMIEPEIRIVSSKQGDGKAPSGTAAHDLLQVMALAEELSAELGAFELRDASLSFENPRTGDVEKVRNADLSAAWSKTAQSISLGGTAEWRGVELDLNAALTEPSAALSDKGSPISLSLSTQQVETSDTGDGTSAWSSCLLPLASRQPIGPVDIEGMLRVDDRRVSLSDADFSFNGGEAAGEISVTQSKGRSRIEGSVAFETLDLVTLGRAYRSEDRDLGAIMSVKSACMEAGDTALSLEADELRLGQFSVTDAALDLETRENRVDFDLRRATLANGSIAGEGNIEADDRGLAVDLDARITDLSVTELGQAFWSIHRSRHPIGIDSPPRGTASAEFRVSARGETPAALWQGLEGHGRIQVRDGSIDGANIVATLDRLKDGNKIIAKGEAPFVPVPGRTHFTELNAALVAEGGTARTEQVHMAGENFEIELAGKLGLDGGLMVAVGTASLFSEDDEKQSRRDDPIVELPFGVGGSVKHPGIAPGIPRIGPRAEAAPASENCTFPERPGRCSRRL